MSDFKPMKAASERPNLTYLKWPKLISIKLDGIRCVAVNGAAYSATMKLIPSKFVQAYFKMHGLHGLDGELTLNGTNDFNRVQSAIMSVDGEPNFAYHVFDSIVSPLERFRMRTLAAEFKVTELSLPRVRYLPQALCRTADEARNFYAAARDIGFEGAILRDPEARYKFGRSTLKQEWMLKLKPIEDDEGELVCMHELVHEDGTSGGVMGALELIYKGHRLKVGTGFDSYQRALYWAQKDSLIGRKVTFKYMELSSYGVPRHPVFKGFRSDLDV